MQIFYWQSSHGNFGDDLNLWLWDHLLPGIRDVSPDTLLVGVGTVLVDDLLPAAPKKLVLGSGVGYNRKPELTPEEKWDIRMVRGPLSAQALGLPAAAAVTDPAIALSDIDEFKAEKQHGTVFVPHWESAVSGDWRRVCDLADVEYLDPTGEAKLVIRRLAEASLVLAESMHAAIIADTLRVPWVPVVTSKGINDFKWRDWAASVGAVYEPIMLPASSLREERQKRLWRGARPAESAQKRGSVAQSAKNLIRPAARLVIDAASRLSRHAEKAAHELAAASRGRSYLSPEAVTNSKKALLYERLAQVRRDYIGDAAA